MHKLWNFPFKSLMVLLSITTTPLLLTISLYQGLKYLVGSDINLCLPSVILGSYHCLCDKARSSS